jgi:putative heme degradation protein
MKARETIDTALKRLATALEGLEAAAERRARTDASRSNIDEEFAVMQDDRTRLALELDAAMARNKALAAANSDVALRLERASATVRAVIATIEPLD